MKLREPIKVIPATKKEGIYFLMDKEQNVLYVGCSQDIDSRVSRHRNDGKIKFHNYAYIEAIPGGRSDLEDLEAYFISKYDPPLNSVIPTSGRWISVRSHLKTTSTKKQKEFADNYGLSWNRNGNYFVDTSTLIKEKL